MEFNNDLIIKNINEYIDAIGYTKKAIADISGLERQKVQRLLTIGKVKNPIDGLSIIAKTVGQNITYFNHAQMLTQESYESTISNIQISFSAKEPTEKTINIANKILTALDMLHSLQKTKTI
jgi:hypothetical protein